MNLFSVDRTLFALLLLGSLGVIIGTNGQASLTIQWNYLNKEGLQENGVVCRITFWRGCNIQFQFCFRKGGISSSENCNLYFVTTKEYKDVKTMKDQLTIEIPQPLPSSYTFELKIDSRNTMRLLHRIASFKATEFNLIPDGRMVNLPITRSGRYKNRKLRVTVSAMLRCAPFFFGSHCEKYCKPGEGRYTCTPDGDRKCSKGYSGVLCDRVDWCVVNPCPGNSTCVTKPDGSERTCVCDEKDATCLQRVDPCISRPCQNGGICRESRHESDGFVCHCTEFWTGSRCNLRLSPCMVAMKQLMLGLKMEPPCLNGGSCVENTENSSFTCLCPPGTKGDRCELTTQLPTKTNWILGAFAALCSLVVLTALVSTCCLILYCRTRHRRRSNTKKVILSSIMSAEEQFLKPLSEMNEVGRPRFWEPSEGVPRDRVCSCEAKRTTANESRDSPKADEYVTMDELEKFIRDPFDHDQNYEENPPVVPTRDLSQKEKNDGSCSNLLPEQSANSTLNNFDSTNLYLTANDLLKDGEGNRDS
ncbi:Delta-like protein 4 [Clonorchis sinensis]|uniref:Delta-like protein 4 n=2 Tax=Clonorchis sinensis TaxID=79923 RepID=A0A8T1MMG8_CLOSI|nr:Delta-like protein 4 [Clonorchis sinensis]GAA47679.1 delta-like protein 4 [Clonorchis sinensis]